jgi:predicted nuclease of predicted toxin-antitoxin system
MPQPPRLHLNENLPPRLAHQLRQLGFDVTSTVELNLIGASDVEQLAYAASTERAIVLLNTLASDDLKNQVRWLNEFR